MLVVGHFGNALLGLFVERVVDWERPCLAPRWRQCALASVFVSVSVRTKAEPASRRVSVSLRTFVLVKQVQQGKQVKSLCGTCRGSAGSLRHAPRWRQYSYLCTGNATKAIVKQVRLRFTWDEARESLETFVLVTQVLLY